MESAGLHVGELSARAIQKYFTAVVHNSCQDWERVEGFRVIARSIRRAGVDFVVTVPDEWSKELLSLLERDRTLELVYATREEEGVGIAAGAQMGGKNTALMVQTSGLGNSINALASLNQAYRIPLLVLASFRGGPGEEFYHKLFVGLSTKPTLGSLGIPCYELETPERAFSLIPDAFHQAQNANTPVVVLIHKRAFA